MDAHGEDEATNHKAWLHVGVLLAAAFSLFVAITYWVLYIPE